MLITELVSVELERELGIDILPIENASELFKSNWSRFALSMSIGFWKVSGGGLWTIATEGTTIEMLRQYVSEHKEEMAINAQKVLDYIAPVTVNPEGPAVYRKEFD